VNPIQQRTIADTGSQARTNSPGAAKTLASLRDEVETQLDRMVTARSEFPTNLHEVMRYSLLGGGKRIRAILCVLVSEAADNRGRAFAMKAGCAIEMVHAASLILDDLPCMDAATTRRGRPTTHRKFGDASSILAAIGLLNRAYEVIAECSATQERTKCEAIRALTKAVGTEGMITGQEMDLNEHNTFSDAANVERLNWLKTGVLFCTAAEMGSISAGLDKKTTDAVRRFSTHIGLAFQTADDVIDQQATAVTAGKDVRQDTDKQTLVSIFGVDGALQSCEEHLELARAALLESGLDGKVLNAFIDSIFANRTRN